MKMKPADVTVDEYIDYENNVEHNVEHNNKYLQFKVADRVRRSKYKTFFAKNYIPNGSEEVFVIKKVKNTIPLTYVINDLKVEEFL